ncbi:hypothetical protein E9993_03535 [Labilibacter sediminis]|nr:hypothetical protein E9993_03535 [Labilibacter sediminis]
MIKNAHTVTSGKTIVWLIIFYPFTMVYSQNSKSDSLIWIKGIVIDEQSQLPIGNVQMVSYKTQMLFVANEEGVFRNSFHISDSVKIFGLGFEAKTFKVKDYINCDTLITVVLSRRSYLIRAVDVAPKRKLALHLPPDIKLAEKNETPPALRNDNFSGKPPVLAAVVSPLSFIHYYTSKSEKRKRAFREELVKHEKQSQINQFYNRSVIEKISGYSGASLDSFVVYCNINLKITERHNPVIVKQMISDLYDIYKTKDN